MHHLLSRLCLTFVAVTGFAVGSLLLNQMLAIDRPDVPTAQAIMAGFWAFICLLLGAIFLKDLPRKNLGTRLLQYLLLGLTGGLPLLDPFLLGLKATTLEVPALVTGVLFIASLWWVPLKSLLMWRPKRKPKALAATAKAALQPAAIEPTPRVAEPVPATPAITPVVKLLAAPVKRPESAQQKLVASLTLLLEDARTESDTAVLNPTRALQEAMQQLTGRPSGLLFPFEVSARRYGTA